MFEIRLDAERDEERTDEDEDKVGGPPCLLSEPAPQQDVDPLNQTLSFQEGEELKLRDWSEGRRGWSQRAPQTLLDALANMDVKSVSEPGRRQWVDGPPDTLLDTLDQADLRSSAVTAGQSGPENRDIRCSGDTRPEGH